MIGYDSRQTSRFEHYQQNGFSLIATVILLGLLALICLGLLQLSGISLRGSRQQLMVEQARANARLAMMMALGQLQKELGPDQRISARSGILDSDPETQTAEGVSQQQYTGVWNASESPFVNWTLDTPSYDKSKSFRGWLVSGDPAKVASLTLAKDDAALGDQFRVAVDAQMSPSRGVKVPVISGTQAGYAWWTSDDGTKSILRPGEKPDSSSKSKTLIAARRSDGDGHAALDQRIPDRDKGLDDRLLDLATVDVTDAAKAAKAANGTGASVSEEMLHDLTTRSEMVPVDVTTGGLRKCMNLKLDWLKTQPPVAYNRNLPPTDSNQSPTIGQYKNPTTDYRLFSWDQLRNYESLSRAGSMVTIDPVTKRPKIRTHKQTGNTNEPEWNPIIGMDRFRVQPVLLKLSYVVSYATERLSAPADPTKPYALRFYLYPMAVLWNPYNIDLEVPEYCTSGTCPLIFDINKGKPSAFKLDLTQNQSMTMLGFGPEMGGIQKMPSGLLIPAGGTKVLYPQPVRWQTHPNEHRYAPRFRWHYYMWAQTTKFDLGDSNFGGVLKNLRGNNSVAYFTSDPANEIVGAPSDTLAIGVTPSSTAAQWQFGMTGVHSDWWGNNGPGGDNQDALQKFGITTTATFKVEGTTPQISLIPESEIPVRSFVELENRPTPLLIFEFYRKAADEDLFPAKYGSFSVAGNPVQPGTDSSFGNTDRVTPWFENPYSFRFKAISSWFDATKTFQLPPNRDDCIYFGASYSPRGQLNVTDQEIPLTPLTSLAQLQHLPLFDYRPTYDPTLATFYTPQWYNGDYWFHEGKATQFPQNHAIGNSFASPGIPADKLNQPGWRHQFSTVANHLRVDRSYIANAVLWDRWFCSSIASQDGLVLTQDGQNRKVRQVAEDFFKGITPLPNDAIQPSYHGDVNQVIASLFDASGAPANDAYEKIAKYIRIEGGFNVNSVSEEAWAHFFSGLLSRPVTMMESATGSEQVTVLNAETGKFLISRNSLINAPPAERETGKAREDRYWNGAREVTAEQIRELASSVVRQVKKRGPFLSLGEFVNRRLVNDPKLAVSGPLQSALDDPKVTINEPFRSDLLTGSEGTTQGSPLYLFKDAAAGPRKQGITGYVTQADLLASLGSSIAPRSDTFTIRAMGEAKDSQGKVQARVWCEAVVQRTADYVDAANEASILPASLTPVNARFGRHFDVVSFRWLNPLEM